MPACAGIQGHGADQHGRAAVQQAVRKWRAAHPAPAAHGGVRARGEDLVHPGARVGRPAGPEPHQGPARFEHEVRADQGSQLGAPENHIAPGQERVKGLGAQLRGHLLEGLGRDQGDGRIHMCGLAEEPVADNPLAGHQLDAVRVRRGDVRCAVAGAAEVRVRGRHEKVEDLDVVPVACRHAFKLP